MGLKIYKPGKEICFDCGREFPKNFTHDYYLDFPISGKVKLCRDCLFKRFDNVIEKDTRICKSLLDKQPNFKSDNL